MRKKFKEMYDELINGENSIKNYLQDNTSFYEVTDIFCLVDSNWIQRYEEFILAHLNNDLTKIFNYDIEDLMAKTEEKKFCLTDGKDNFSYNIPLKYTLVTSNFISMIVSEIMSQYCSSGNRLKFIKFFPVFIGENFLFWKGFYSDYYITLLYDEIGDNYVDFILHFKNIEKMEEYFNILKNNNFFSYMEIIKYSNELIKEIKDFEDDIIIGYLFRNCDETRGKYLLEMKDNIFKYSQEKKENNMTNKNNLEKITSNNNSNINEYLKNNINTNNMNKEQ